ncbi:MAG TPA: zinc-ribbon domain containing protein [Oscillospiraceae bacterium]|nr:zinc-ribbon domain containing protein [Oscillospiraceae bacterium]
MHQDKTITCKDCGQEFVFTASEQDFFEEKGFENEPQRCPSCRRARKNGGRSQSGQQREMYSAICSACGRECKVPFQPRNDRPIYCSDCFAERRR